MIHIKSLLRAALRLTSNIAAAEDLTQETLLRAWRAWEQYTPGTNCRAWLFRILLNVYNRAWTRQSAAPATISLEECTEPTMPTAPPTPMLYMPLEVVSALHALPEAQRVVLVLGVVEGFRCREIAEILGIPIGTVMSRMSRARQEMQHLLAPRADASSQHRAQIPPTSRRRLEGGKVQ